MRYLHKNIRTPYRLKHRYKQLEPMCVTGRQTVLYSNRTATLMIYILTQNSYDTGSSLVYALSIELEGPRF
jgi:hypothetical protein